MNNITITGNLCFDPEFKESNGKSFVRMRVANSEKQGENTKTNFFDAMSFWNLEEIQKYKKGDGVIITGKMDEWKREDKSSAYTIIINSIGRTREI